MNSGSSAFIGSGGQLAGWPATRSAQAWSRPGCIATAPPVFFATMTLRMDGQLFSASSAFTFSGTFLPLRRPSSAVISSTQSLSWMRLARLSGLKPPNTMLWMAPTRAQASMATAASTIIGR